MTPDSLTLASIALQGSHTCGCHRIPYHPRDWRPCEYHEGYEDGIEAARRGDEATR